jgi:hypothetical protein
MTLKRESGSTPSDAGLRSLEDANERHAIATPASGTGTPARAHPGRFSGICAVAMTAFNLGFTHGTAARALGVVVYSVPATLFDWPRITFSDVIELISAAVSAVVEFFKSLFDW